MKDFKVVFSYYLKKEIKSMSYIILTIILCIFSFASCFIIKSISSTSDKEDVYIIDRTNQVVNLLKNADISDIFFSEIKLNFKEQSSLMSNTDIENLVIEKEKVYAIFDNKNNNMSLSLVHNGSVNNSDIQKLLYLSKELIKQQNIIRLGVSEEVVKQLDTKINLEVINPTQKTENTVITSILFIIMIMVIILFSATATNEITYLKTNKVMEILITSTKSLSLYVGVVLSYGLSALIQMVLVVLFTSMSIKLTGINLLNLDELGICLANLSFTNIFIYIIFFILGFLLFTFINTAIASIINKTEDSTKTVPVLMLIMLQYCVSFAALSGDSFIVSLCSYVPITSSSVMFVRYMLGYVDIYNVIISLIILTLSIGVVAILGSKMFSKGVIHYGTVKNFKL